MVFKFSTTQVPGNKIGLVSQSNYRAMCNWPNYFWWVRGGQIISRVIFACGRTGYHSFRAQLVSNMHRPTKKYYRMSVFPVLCYFIK